MTRRIVAVLLTLVSAACRTAGSQAAPPIVQPGAPGEASHVIAAGKATDLSRVQATAADVRFMQGMIHHHAQDGRQQAHHGGFFPLDHAQLTRYLESAGDPPRPTIFTAVTPVGKAVN